jgi:hypothetical protein
MAIIVVGGGPRKVGKTSVVGEIISALREQIWTALKITPHRHEAEVGSPRWRIVEEKDRLGNSDTSRYLAAGAARAYLVEAAPESLHEAMPQVRKLVSECGNAIIESNSILEFLQPDLCLAIIDPSAKDVKPSAEDVLSQADAVIMHGNDPPADSGRTSKIAEGMPRRPIFLIEPPPYVTPEIINFVRKSIIAPE